MRYNACQTVGLKAGQDMAEDEHTIQITLPLPEALVLFEWAYRFTETRRLQFSHAAEAIVIDLVASELEWKLPTVFTDEYPALLAGARNSVQGHIATAWATTHNGLKRWLMRLRSQPPSTV